MRLNFSQAARVVCRSLLRAPWPRPRFMNGKSSAHQARPITGTQISSRFKKNFRNGMWPWKMRCSTRMSTQLWWLLDTRYQPRGCRLSTPCTSQRAAGPTAAIQALLSATQVEASALSARSAARCTPASGTSNLTSAGGTRLAVTSKVFRPSATPVKTPRRAAGTCANAFNLRPPAVRPGSCASRTRAGAGCCCSRRCARCWAGSRTAGRRWATAGRNRSDPRWSNCRRGCRAP